MFQISFQPDWQIDNGFLTGQSWCILKSWYTGGAQNMDFSAVSQTDLTRVYEKCTAVVSSVVQVTAVCTPQHCDSSVKILYFCALRSCSTILLQVCWRMSFVIPADVCCYNIIQYHSKVSYQSRLVSCGWELHRTLRDSRGTLLELHSDRIIEAAIFGINPARNQQNFHLGVPQRLRKTGVRFCTKFLLRSFVLNCH